MLMENFVEVKEILKQFRFFRDKEHYYLIICLGLSDKWDDTFILRYRENKKCVEDFISGDYFTDRSCLADFINKYKWDELQYQKIEIDNIPQNIQLEIYNELKKRNIKFYEK